MVASKERRDLKTHWTDAASIVAVICLLAMPAALSAAATRVLLIAGPDSHGWGCHEHRASIELLAGALDKAGLDLGRHRHQRSIFCKLFYHRENQRALIGKEPRILREGSISLNEIKKYLEK